MTEKEKMIAGKVYNSQDSELVAALNKSKSLCRQYNNCLLYTSPSPRD